MTFGTPKKGYHVWYISSDYLKPLLDSLSKLEHELCLSSKQLIGMLSLYDCFLPLMSHSDQRRIEVGYTLVKKTFMHAGSADHVAHLSAIYGLLQKKRVPYADKLVSMSTTQGHYIKTSPVGRNQWPDDGTDAHAAVICVLKALMVLSFHLMNDIINVLARSCMLPTRFQYIIEISANPTS